MASQKKTSFSLHSFKRGPSKPSHAQEETELRVVLVGKSGGGRSATGNTILGAEKFDSQLSLKPVTQTCQQEMREKTWEGKQVVVIDTPAIFYSSAANRQEESQKCHSLAPPGPHALVFVTQVGRFTKEDEEAVEQVEKIFGNKATRYMVLLFTRKEDLDSGNLTKYIEGSNNKSLKKLAEKCGGRCCAFDNKATREERDQQAGELLRQIGEMLRQNRDKPYLQKPSPSFLKKLGRPGKDSGGKPHRHSKDSPVP